MLRHMRLPHAAFILLAVLLSAPGVHAEGEGAGTEPSSTESDSGQDSSPTDEETANQTAAPEEQSSPWEELLEDGFPPETAIVDCGAHKYGRPDGYTPPLYAQPDLSDGTVNLYTEGERTGPLAFGSFGMSVDYTCTIPI